MKIMNENGKHKLRRSDRIQKIIQKKLLQDDPYHLHKKQCNIIDVLERKIHEFEERLNVLEKKEVNDVNEPVYEDGFPWDVVFILIGIVMLFYYAMPPKIEVRYISQSAIEKLA